MEFVILNLTHNPQKTHLFLHTFESLYLFFWIECEKVQLFRIRVNQKEITKSLLLLEFVYMEKKSFLFHDGLG